VLTVQLPDNPKLESIMVGKLGLTAMLVVALTPMPALGQVSSTDDPSPESAVEGQWTADESVVADAGPFVSALQLPAVQSEALVPSALDPSSTDEPLIVDESATASAAASKGSGTGLGFMIGGAAALVGGLLIGGTGGNLIAAGGVALGVYGAIVYF